METRFALVKYGKHLWTRELARRVRTSVNEQLDDLGPGSTLALDLKGVEVFDFSFANELFGKTVLAMPNEYPGRFLLVENLTEYTRENLSKALESLGLVMVERHRGELSLIGKYHPADEETFAAVVASKNPISAGALSKQLGVNLTAMNERLSKLASLALVRREKAASTAGREQYEYRVLS